MKNHIIKNINWQSNDRDMIEFRYKNYVTQKKPYRSYLSTIYFWLILIYLILLIFLISRMVKVGLR